MSEELSVGRILSEKKYGGTGLTSVKTEALHVELSGKGAQNDAHCYCIIPL